MSASEAILAMTDPLAQRYAFCRYVLGEPRMEAAALAAHFAPLGLLDAEEYDLIVAGWAS